MTKRPDQEYSVNLTTNQHDSTSASDRVKWFQEARFGIFVHWGLYSELAGSYGGRTLPDRELPYADSWYSEWIQMRLEIPRDNYQALARSFDPVNLDMEAWVREVAMAGARYMVLTTKHHDGFALWNSGVSDFDLSISPCRRDILGEMVSACRKHGVRVGFYYSHWQDWEHPGGALPPWPDKEQPTDEAFERYWQEKSLPQVRELLERYQPDMLWFDTWGDKAAGQITAARRDEMIDLIRSVQPDCLINGRLCAHEPGERIDYISAGDNQHPKHNLGRPWQTPATMNHTWAWHAHDFHWKSTAELLHLLVTNASLGGNYLLNIGPLADGTIPAPSIRRLREIGGWMAAHGEAIYDTTPLDDIPVPNWGRLTGRVAGDSRVIYAHVEDWQNERLTLPEEAGIITSAVVLETGEVVTVEQDGRSFKKPEGGIHPAVSVIKLFMEPAE